MNSKEIVDDSRIFFVDRVDFIKKRSPSSQHIRMMMMKVYENLFFVLIFVLKPNKNNCSINYCRKGLDEFLRDLDERFFFLDFNWQKSVVIQRTAIVH